MKKFYLLLVLTATIISNACQGQTTQNLSTGDFNKQLNTLKDYQLVDVRTKEEFNNGHLKGALNIDYNNASEFERLIAFLDKDKPTMVYCLAGGRSAKAVEILKKKGFKNLYDMNGGYNAWSNAKLPVEMPQGASESKGMSMEDFKKSIPSGQSVFVEFGTQWCPPCKKLSASLDSLEKEHLKNVAVIKIDIDKNKELAKEMKVETFPTLFLFKNGKQATKAEGYQSVDKLKKMLY